MYAQFFGNYLLSHGITKEQLMHAMQEANSEHPKLGTLAMHAGYMSASEVDRVIIMQTHEDKRFGELAIREGYLTEAQVKKEFISLVEKFRRRYIDRDFKSLEILEIMRHTRNALYKDGQ